VDTAGAPKALRKTLHERGMRMTPQRQLVLDAVQVTAPTVNITTVYRTLDLLDRLGLVRHTHLGHGAPNYSVDAHEHVHLVCHRCGQVDEVPCGLLSPLGGTLRDRYGFELDASHLALSGTCRECLSALKESE
jgi:Fur family transcriptional regulator, ferric uptake regulator